MIDEHLYALLSGNASIMAACPRIYPVAPPSDVAYPLITYQEIGNNWQYSWDGPNDLLNSQVLLDVYAEVKADAIAVGEVVVDELKAYSGAMGTKTIRRCEVEQAFARPQDNKTKLYGVVIILDIWYH